jgi:capsular polysaccharide transport system permease protein
MTTKPRARRFRVRRATPLTEGMVPPQQPAAPDPATERPEGHATGHATGHALRPYVVPGGAREGAVPAQGGEDDAIEAIRREGLTGRQLRMARRVAQKHGLSVASDFDAVRQLRARGIDPFQQTSFLELVQGGRTEAQMGDPEPEAAPAPDAVPPDALPPGGRGRALAPRARAALPQAVPGPQLPGAPAPANRPEPADRRAAEILRIQRDIARRRRRRAALLFARLFVFVMLPTMLAGYYFTRVATPMYATQSEFVIQKAEAQGMAAAGLGGLFQGTSMATQQDSMTVQAYLASREAMQRLDAEHGFRAAFADPAIDPIQRLPEGASNEALYDLYRKHVKISYDPTEGIVKMEVIAPDPQLSEEFSEALLRYAEERVDAITQRLREDQMKGARDSYEAAEARRSQALADWLRIQQEVRQIDPVGETAARTSQISALETERQRLQLELQTRLSVARPNQAQVEALRSQIANIEGLIASLREEMTQASEAGASLAARNTELRVAEENYAFQTLLVQQALTQMEAAQIEANRQVRYLSLGVEPVAPDEATYPRAFENTVLAFLIFAGLYLMLSLTASILREQVTS